MKIRPSIHFPPFARVFAAGLGLSFAALSGARAQAELSAEAKTRMNTEIAALQSSKAARTPVQRKIDSQLLYARQQVKTGVAHAAAPRLRVDLANVSTTDKRLELDVKGKITDALLSTVGTLGGTVVNSHPEYGTVRILLPLANVETLAAQADVRHIRPAVYGERQTGAVDSEGDYTHQAIQERQNIGYNGAGIIVGVMSDSIDDGMGALSNAINSGDVDPNNLYIIQGQDGNSNAPHEAEGLAMCEIVHDIAPGAVIVFATCTPGDAQMAANVRTLASVGCQIIIDDYTYPDESPFQDSVISQAVDDATNAGVFYFSSARNSGNYDQGKASVWEGDFRSGGSADNLSGGSGTLFHAFTRADGSSSILNPIVTNGNNGGSLTLFWSDPLGASANDYDLVELDSNGHVVGVSDNAQDGSEDPYESISSAANPGDYMVVVKAYGAARFLHVEDGRLILGINTPGAVRGHNCNGSANAFSVAATPAAGSVGDGTPNGPYPNAFTSSAITETFSCDGPRRIFYDRYGNPYTPGNYSSSGGAVLYKPDFTAADGVSTTLPYQKGLNPFFGTSCAAPHAGAIAALVLSARPDFNINDLRAVLAYASIDIMGQGFDRDSGTGILNAYAAIQGAFYVPYNSKADFNRDGNADLIYQNPSTGDRQIWFLKNGVYQSSKAITNLPAAYSIAGAADFNGDGYADIIFQNMQTGDRQIWFLKNGVYQGYKDLGVVSTAYTIVGAADFNGDGYADIIFQNPQTGDRQIWFLKNGVFQSSKAITNIPAVYSIAGAADFNGDGYADIVFQNTQTGDRQIWFLKNGVYQSYKDLGVVTTAYNIVGTGDFNNDNLADIVFENPSTGDRQIWFLRNGVYQGYKDLGVVSKAYGICNR